MALLRVEKVAKSYSRRRVVDGVTLDVDRGEVVGLLGRNGAGKTTTFRMVIGLIRPEEGKVFFNGSDVCRLPIYRRARLGMGFLPQETSVFQRLSVEDNVLAVLELTDVPARERRAKARSMLEEYGLSKLAGQKAFTLSGGETRRLEICRAMTTKPSILLLDEPFSGIDPIAVAELQGFIRKLKEGDIGVLLTDHNVRETLAITDRSYIIDEGMLLAHGTPEEIVADPEVRKRYLGTEFRL
ncbi:MAG: LPS export ABC transporter ATP-binding protein [Planctomycetota bacterium]|jgi:lipopolysaccharide export system ATP-binding protein